MKQTTPVGDDNQESRLIWQFFDCATKGFFVEVGANHPTELNQTWFLEQQGWSGVLIEPNPNLCGLLRAQRPRSRTFQAAVGNAEQTGEVELFLGESHVHSTLKPFLDDPLSGAKIRVPLRTLDSILAEAGAGRIDFLSIDVEGLELQVLRGFDLARHRPAVLLVEDHLLRLDVHRHLARHGYRVVKRTGENNWYVPKQQPFHMTTWTERLKLFRKMFLGLPFRKVRLSLRRRQHHATPAA